VVGEWEGMWWRMVWSKQLVCSLLTAMTTPWGLVGAGVAAGCGANILTLGTYLMHTIPSKLMAQCAHACAGIRTNISIAQQR
jgi:hypothetical protein